MKRELPNEQGSVRIRGLISRACLSSSLLRLPKWEKALGLASCDHARGVDQEAEGLSKAIPRSKGPAAPSVPFQDDVWLDHRRAEVEGMPEYR